MPTRRARRTSRAATTKRPRASRKTPKRAAGFVGREGSPVLDRYPPKDPGFGTPRRLVVTTTPEPAAAPPAASAGSAPAPLITFERPFDPDEFSALLGATSIRMNVPSSELPEVLRRVMEFMGFGIYVYTISVRPAPSELLKEFVVELHRVDYSPETGTWLPFVEKGSADSPPS